jgi:hypothetical protein
MATITYGAGNDTSPPPATGQAVENTPDGVVPQVVLKVPGATNVDLPGDAANGLDVDVTRVSGNVAVTVADSGNVVEGAVADAAVVTDAAGTLSAKLRGLIKWAYERMPASLGQKVMATSFPVVIASDQSAVPVNVSETIPTSTFKTNPSYTLVYTGSNLTSITKTISGVPYQKTFTYTGSNLTSISAWV